MRTTHTRIPDAFGGGSTIVEHVYLDDIIEAWDAAFERAGMDPATLPAIAALRRLLDKAGVLTLSTWGQVYRADQARGDLARALAASGVGAAIEDRAEPAVLH